MLSYRHAFHAGNFADVLKHAVLTLLLEGLKQKDKPFCYLETHAGAGRYDLRSREARQHREFRDGIARVWSQPAPPPELASYLASVRAVNAAGDAGRPATLRYYPGSPRIAHSLLRPGDRMVLSELHPTDLRLLREEFAGDPRVAVHDRDGYLGLKASLPPAERRGLVLMDPAFELPGEARRLVAAFAAAWQRWPTGIFALWYPLVERRDADRFHESLKATGIPRLLVTELLIFPDDTAMGLNGTGMVIANPPWLLEARLQALLPWLRNCLGQSESGGWSVRWLVPEAGPGKPVARERGMPATHAGRRRK